jgi:hypothetical protein
VDSKVTAVQQSRDQRSAGVSAHRIGGKHRVALTVAGLASWLAGALAEALTSVLTGASIRNREAPVTGP